MRLLLHTPRLLLRPFRATDVDAFSVFAGAADYRRHLDASHPEPAAFVANNLDVDGAWVIERDGAVVGSIFLGDELACLLDPAVHGQGIATEAAAAVIDDGFGRRRYAVIVARASAANTASLRAMEKLGFADHGDGTHRLDGAAWAASRSG